MDETLALSHCPAPVNSPAAGRRPFKSSAFRNWSIIMQISTLNYATHPWQEYSRPCFSLVCSHSIFVYLLMLIIISFLLNPVCTKSDTWFPSTFYALFISPAVLRLSYLIPISSPFIACPCVENNSCPHDILTTQCPTTVTFLVAPFNSSAVSSIN